MSPRGGLRVVMVTLRISPSAAALTASSPSSAPVGTTMRAPASRAPLDEIDMVEQRAGAQGHEDAPAGDRRLGDGAELPRRQAFDDDVGATSELSQRHDRDGDAGRGKPRLRPRGIARGDCGQPESRQALRQLQRDREPDGTQAADGDRKDLVRG